jgi:hypothetical protein
MEKVINLLEREPFFRIYASKVEEPIKLEAEEEGEIEQFSTFAEVNLSVQDFRSLVRLMFFYGPTGVEVIKPGKIEFTLDDFQNGLVDMGEMVQGYAKYIGEMMNRRQVENFNAKMYSQPKAPRSKTPKNLENAPNTP